MDNLAVELVRKMVNNNSNETNDQDSFGLESVMQPLTPEVTRQPLSEAMQRQKDEPPRSEASGVENIDEIVQEGGSGNNQNATDQSVVDRQINIANRSAS